MTEAIAPQAPKSSKIKTAVHSTKKFLIKHRTAIAVVTAIAVTGSLSLRASSEIDNFLARKGLTDEYYGTEAVATDTVTQ